jgi:hypothetical protein
MQVVELGPSPAPRQSIQMANKTALSEQMRSEQIVFRGSESVRSDDPPS